MLVFALYFSFRTSVRLSLVFLGTTVILGLGLYLSIRHVYPVFVRVFKRYDKMNRIVQENLFAIRVVKNYTRESHEKRNFAAVSKLIYEDFTTAGIRIARISPLMNFCVFLSTTLIAWFWCERNRRFWQQSRPRSDNGGSSRALLPTRCKFW